MIYCVKHIENPAHRWVSASNTDGSEPHRKAFCNICTNVLMFIPTLRMVKITEEEHNPPSQAERLAEEMTCWKHFSKAGGFVQVPTHGDEFQTVLCCGQCMHDQAINGFKVYLINRENTVEIEVPDTITMPFKTAIGLAAENKEVQEEFQLWLGYRQLVEEAREKYLN